MEPIMAGAVSARGELRPSERVVEAVATREGCDPTELHPPLFTAVDPDALDTLFSAGASNGSCTLAFVYRGLEIVVDRDGAVHINGD